MLDLSAVLITITYHKPDCHSPTYHVLKVAVVCPQSVGTAGVDELRISVYRELIDVLGLLLIGLG